MKEKPNYFWIYLIVFITGILIGSGIVVQKNDKKLEGFTLVKNQSNDWYAIQNHDYTQFQLSEYYTLKNILISNECPDGGYIENKNNQILIVCYELKKIIDYAED